MITPSDTPGPQPGHPDQISAGFLFRRLCAVVVTIALIGLPAVWAQKEAGGLPPELAPLAAKYHADLDALAPGARAKAVTALRQSYLTALGVAGQKAGERGQKPDESKAVAEEKETRSPPGERSRLTEPRRCLPHELATPRAHRYSARSARAEHEYTGACPAGREASICGHWPFMRTRRGWRNGWIFSNRSRRKR